MTTHSGLRLLAVHAHPDDESSKGAATTAMYVAAGATVMVVSCAGGERGDVLNPALADDPRVTRDIAEFRRHEMAEAARILGVEHVWLGFTDSGLPEGDPRPALPDGCFALEPLDVTTEALVRVIREFRPHVMTTYNEQGGYPHPDHIMTHHVAVAAFDAAGDAAAYPHAGRPWQPLKMYYDVTFSRAKIEAFHEALISRGEESPFGEWLANWDPDRGIRSITTRVSCGEFFETRDAALRAHATQVDPVGTWFKLPMEYQIQTWPTEDFEAAVSYVPIADGEDDLFAGLGGPEQADSLALAPPTALAYDERRTPVSVPT